MARRRRRGRRARCAGVTSSAVNPTIEAAVIAAGSTVFITSVSTCASAWTTVRTFGTTVYRRLSDWLGHDEDQGDEAPADEPPLQSALL